MVHSGRLDPLAPVTLRVCAGRSVNYAVATCVYVGDLVAVIPELSLARLPGGVLVTENLLATLSFDVR